MTPKKLKDGVRPTRRLLLGAGLTAPVMAAAQTWPVRPIRFLVPFGPGSTSDIIARQVALAARDSLGQPLVIENRAGAGGLIAAEMAARAAPDGYTLCFGTIASHAVSPAMAPSLPFDLIDDFLPVTRLVDAPSLIVVNRDVPATSLAGYLGFARRRGHSTFVSAGQGSLTHLAGEVLRVRHAAPLEHVPYSLFGNALTDLLAGRVDMLCYQAPALLPHLASGAIRALCVLAPRRVALFPALPTAVEELGDPELDFTAWFGAFLPAETPRAIADRLHAAFLVALENAALRETLAAQCCVGVGWGPNRFREFFVAEVPRWRRIVETTGVLLN